METPSSTRRITRSQASKQERPANAERSALLDITNDSPIVGLALSSVPSEKTPSSSAAKGRVVAPARKAGTPGSGEALLRGQVRTLLQKVEEEEGETAASRRPSGEPRTAYRVLLDLPGPSPSPVQLLAPTPANTPQVAGLSAAAAAAPMDAVEEVCVETDAPQAGLKEEEEEEPQNAPECLVNRALLFDSPGKSESSDCAASAISSSLTYQDSETSCEKSPEDDSSSAWSLQVNTSSHHDEEEEYEEEEEEEYEEEGEECFDELCEGLSRMSMNSEKAGLPEFTGMHTRFVYSNDDDEEVEREEVVVKGGVVSPSAVLLKGLPFPQGKHLRFHDEEEDE